MSELFKSKKFIVAALGLVAVVLSSLLQAVGVSVPEEKITEFLAVIVAYVVGQGLADLGKEKAKVESAPPAPPPVRNGGGI